MFVGTFNPFLTDMGFAKMIEDEVNNDASARLAVCEEAGARLVPSEAGESRRTQTSAADVERVGEARAA